MILLFKGNYSFPHSCQLGHRQRYLCRLYFHLTAYGFDDVRWAALLTSHIPRVSIGPCCGRCQEKCARDTSFRQSSSNSVSHCYSCSRFFFSCFCLLRSASWSFLYCFLSRSTCSLKALAR